MAVETFVSAAFNTSWDVQEPVAGRSISGGLFLQEAHEFFDDRHVGGCPV